MTVTRREFIKGGVSAFTVGFAAPAFLSDLALGQGASRRTLVVLYLSGGSDALSMLPPYTDPFYASRRPAPVDPLAGWSTVREVPRTLRADHVSVPAIPSVSGYTMQSPNTGAEAGFS